MEKYYLSEIKNNSKNFSTAVYEIYRLTSYIHEQYPNHLEWFYGKCIPRVLDGTGEVIFYLDGYQIIGVSILKNDSLEKKICTFMISEEYRKKGYSKLLLEDSFQFLGTTKPVITIPKFRIPEFQSIIEAYGWEKTEEITNYSSPEYGFNTKLIKKI